jgi:tetratricopeptide (TPR) repeat protein
MSDRWWAAAVIVAITGAVFLQMRNHEFLLFDDPAYVVNNPILDAGMNIEAVGRVFTEPYFANWIPLTILSYKIDHALYGKAPRGYMLTNLALHLVGALLLFLVFERMTGALWPSAFIAAVFAVHPLHVESVAWVSERKDVLAGVFWMATLLAYARFAKVPGIARYLVVAACLAAGLLAKPTVVTLPFVLLLLDYWPLQRLGDSDAPFDLKPALCRRAALEKLPLLALVVIASTITLLVQQDAGAVHLADAPALRVMNAIDSYGHYLRDSFWPTGLAPFYPHPVEQLGAGSVAVTGTAIVAISAAALWTAKRFPFLLVGWAWFLGTLVPMIGMVQVGIQARADRYMYLSLIGLAIVVAFGAATFSRRRPAASIPAAVLGGVAVLALAAVAHVQTGYWRTNEILFERMLAVTEDNHKAHRQVGNARLNAGELAEAEWHFREALAAQPGWGVANLDLGLVLIKRGRFQEAQQELEIALAHGADEADTRAALGLAAENLGRLGEAIAYYQEALALDAEDFSVANNLAWLFATAKPTSFRNPEEAIRLAEGALERASENPDVLDTLAASYAAAGRFDDAVRTQTRAVERVPASRRDEFRNRLKRYQHERGRSE